MKLLVAVDGSAESDRALEYAADLAAATDGSLTLVHSVDPDVYDAGGSEPVAGLSDAERRLVAESVADAEERGERVLSDAADHVGDAADHGPDAGVAVETELLYGDPVATVPEFAADGGYDGIVVGHRGLSARHERVLGSVAKALVERSSAPVTVVR